MVKLKIPSDAELKALPETVFPPSAPWTPEEQARREQDFLQNAVITAAAPPTEKPSLDMESFHRTVEKMAEALNQSREKYPIK